MRLANWAASITSASSQGRDAPASGARCAAKSARGRNIFSLCSSSVVGGLPAQVVVQRSSGYPRLDAQALGAMRQARFRPHTEDGVALEVEVIAPIEYPLE